MQRKEIDLKDFLQVSLRVGPLLGDIEKLARMTPIEKDRQALWALREQIFQIYLRYWSVSRGVFPTQRRSTPREESLGVPRRRKRKAPRK